MNILGLVFNTILINPITNILVVIYQAILFLHIPYPLGFSIIGLTILIRLILHPFTASQLKTTKKMQELAPHIAKLKEKHKGNNLKIQQETALLYKENGINQATGCIMLLVQMPIFIALYNVLNEVVRNDPQKAVGLLNKALYVPTMHLIKPLDVSFFGLSVVHSPNEWAKPGIGLVILIVPIVTALLQYIQSKMMMAATPPLPPVDKKNASVVTKEEDMQAAIQGQMGYFLPLFMAFISYSAPLGVSLYLNTITIFGILQQYQISGWGSLTHMRLPFKK